MEQSSIQTHIDQHYKEPEKQTLEHWLEFYEEEVPDAKNKTMKDFVKWVMESHDYSFTADFHRALSLDDRKMTENIRMSEDIRLNPDALSDYDKKMTEDVCVLF